MVSRRDAGRGAEATHHCHVELRGELQQAHKQHTHAGEAHHGMFGAHMWNQQPPTRDPPTDMHTHACAAGCRERPAQARAWGRPAARGHRVHSDGQCWIIASPDIFPQRRTATCGTKLHAFCQLCQVGDAGPPGPASSWSTVRLPGSAPTDMFNTVFGGWAPANGAPPTPHCSAVVLTPSLGPKGHGLQMQGPLGQPALHGCHAVLPCRAVDRATHRGRLQHAAHQVEQRPCGPPRKGKKEDLKAWALEEHAAAATTPTLPWLQPILLLSCRGLGLLGRRQAHCRRHLAQQRRLGKRAHPTVQVSRKESEMPFGAAGEEVGDDLRDLGHGPTRRRTRAPARATRPGARCTRSPRSS